MANRRQNFRLGAIGSFNGIAHKIDLAGDYRKAHNLVFMRGYEIIQPTGRQ